MTNRNKGAAKQPERAQRKNLNRRLNAAGYTSADPVYNIAHTLFDGWSLSIAELVDAAERLAMERPQAA